VVSADHKRSSKYWMYTERDVGRQKVDGESTKNTYKSIALQSLVLTGEHHYSVGQTTCNTTQDPRTTRFMAKACTPLHSGPQVFSLHNNEATGIPR
jgi:hypothetical protein